MCRAIGLASDVPKKTASLFKDVAYEWLIIYKIL
jgi:hypothetical protein